MPDESRAARRSTTSSGTFGAEPAQSPAQPATSPAQPATSPAQPATSPAQPATSPAQPATTNENWESRYKGVVSRAQEISRQCEYLLSRLSRSSLSTADVHQVLLRLARETKALQ